MPPPPGCPFKKINILNKTNWLLWPFGKNNTHVQLFIFAISRILYGHVAHIGGEAQHVTHPALGPGRVFVWVTWLALCSVSVKIKPGASVKRLCGCQRLRHGALLPSAAFTPAQSAQAVQLWPTKSSRLGTRRSRAAITLTARSRSAIITARQAAYVIFRALDRVGTSCVRAPEPETPTHILLEDKSSQRPRESRGETIRRFIGHLRSYTSNWMTYFPDFVWQYTTKCTETRKEHIWEMYM